jgi:hypothetical protein
MINLLEMRAVLLALSHFKLCLESLSIVLATNNTTVVAYLKNQGATHCYSLYQLAKEVLILCVCEKGQTGNWRCQGEPCHDIFPLQPPRQMRRENFQDRNRGFSIMRRRGPMLEKIKL